MPVSPQDFALWSRMTGNPMPRTPAEQMALAPQVYQFNRQLEQRPSGIRQFIDTAGRAALGAGLLTGATLLGAKLAQQAPRSQARTATGDFEADELIPGKSEMPGKIEGYEGTVIPEATTPGTLEDLLAQGRETLEGTHRTTAEGRLEGPSPSQAAFSELGRQSRDVKRSDIYELSGAFDLPASQESQEFLGKFAGKLQLDDEPQVDNDVVAAEPLSTVGKVSGDVTAADPASDINQRVLPAQTQARVAEARATPQPTTVAENLATKQSPVHAARQFVGQAQREAEDFFNRALGLQSAQKRKELASQVTGASAQPAVEGTTIEVAPVAREVKTASFSTNPYLSAMSQAEGPSQTYGIDPKRSRAISEMTFYPGGELGVELQTKRGPKEYVYAMADPYREAVGQYAEEGFPSGMGQIGRIATPKATAVSIGVQRPVGKGGVPTGAESKVLFKETPEAKDIRLGLEERAAAREASVEEGDRATFGGSSAAAFLKKKAIETIGKIAESPV